MTIENLTEAGAEPAPGLGDDVADVNGSVVPELPPPPQPAAQRATPNTKQSVMAAPRTRMKGTESSVLCSRAADVAGHQSRTLHGESASARGDLRLLALVLLGQKASVTTLTVCNVNV